MLSFARPNVVISRCIDFDSCRYDGRIVRASLREELEPHIHLVPICPELEIGLGVPRDPIRIVARGTVRRLVQPSSGRDLTMAMTEFASGFLDRVVDVDGFILKSRSPSCGLRDAKTFASEEAQAAIGQGAGMFATAVRERFPHAAVEDEQRLGDVRLREQFMTKLFTLAALREAIAQAQMRALLHFHARSEPLLVAYGEREARALARILASSDGDVASVGERYREQMAAALDRPPRRRPEPSILEHAFPPALGRECCYEATGGETRPARQSYGD